MTDWGGSACKRNTGAPSSPAGMIPSGRDLMRSGARLGAVLLTLGVAAFIFGGQASPSRAATSAPALLRDVDAARFLVHPAATATTTADVIQPDTQIEPSVAANPNNPLNAVVGFQEGRRDSGGGDTHSAAHPRHAGKSEHFCGHTKRQ